MAAPCVELVEIDRKPGQTVYRVLVDHVPCGFATKTPRHTAAPWSLSLIGRFAGIKRPTRRILVETVEKLLDPDCKPVAYVPAGGGPAVERMAGRLRTMGFEVRAAPGPCRDPDGGDR